MKPKIKLMDNIRLPERLINASPNNMNERPGGAPVRIIQDASHNFEIRESIAKAKDLVDKTPSDYEEDIEILSDENTPKGHLILLAKGIPDQATQEKAWRIIAHKEKVDPKIRLDAVLRIKKNDSEIRDLKDQILMELIHSKDLIGKLSEHQDIYEIENTIISKKVPEFHQDDIRRVLLIDKLDNADKKMEVLLNFKNIIQNVKGQDFNKTVRWGTELQQDPIIKAHLLFIRALDPSLVFWMAVRNAKQLYLVDQKKHIIAIKYIRERANHRAKDGTLEISQRIDALGYMSNDVQIKLIIPDLANELIKAGNFDETIWRTLITNAGDGDEGKFLPRFIIDQPEFSKEFRKDIAQSSFKGDELFSIVLAINQDRLPGKTGLLPYGFVKNR